MTREIPRRTLARGIGVAATAGLLAGCSTETQDGDGGDGGDGSDGNDGGDDATDTEGGDGGDGGDGDVPSEVEDYLSDAMNYEGGVTDETGTDNPTVAVGAGNGLSFDPAAIRVSSGTTITWEWTGQGGEHNVVHEEEEFHSGDAVTEEGNTFEYTFEESGNYLYYCDPHEASGMKGAVVVE